MWKLNNIHLNNESKKNYKGNFKIAWDILFKNNNMPKFEREYAKQIL